MLAGQGRANTNMGGGGIGRRMLGAEQYGRSLGRAKGTAHVRCKSSPVLFFSYKLNIMILRVTSVALFV